MFRRLFWFAAGITTGVWATMKVGKAARRLTPDGLAATAADRAHELGGRARRFADDVRLGMNEREAELGQALGLDDAPSDRRSQLPGPRPAIASKRHPNEQKEGH
jgi:Family of unknown function (DUF6167)